jgi:PAS domain S-box-containing protein
MRNFETPKFDANFPKLRENLLKSGRNLFETEAVAKNGEIIPFEVSTRLITYKGKPAVIGVTRDLRERRKNEARLRESEEIYRTILENAPDPVSITVDAKIVYANPSRVKLAGAQSMNELIGKDAYEFVHKEDISLLKEQNFYSINEGAPPKSLEFRITGSNGAYIHVETISTPIKYMGQNAVLNILHDITQRISYEERLSSLHEYARNLAIADTIKDASRVVGDAVQGMLETSFGSIGIVVGSVLRFEHVYGVDWDVGGEMPITGRGVTTRAVRTGETQLIPDVSRDPDYYLTESSIQKPRSEVAVPIKVEGKVVAVLNVENPQLNAYTWDDVQILETLGNHFATAIQRIRVVEGIKTSEEKYRNLFEGVNDALFIHRLDGRFIEVNEVACERLGYTRDELLKLHFQDIDASPDKKFILNLRKTLNESGQVTFETIHKSKTGELIDTEINARSIELNGVPATLSTCRDIRERKRMEKGLAALHSVVSLLAEVDTVSDIWDITLHTLETILGQHWANINVVQGNFLTFVESIGASPPMKIKNLTLDGPGIIVRAVKTGKTQLVPDVLVDPDYVASYTEDGVTYPTRSELVIPVLIDGMAYAVINLESKLPNDFSTDDQRLMEILAGHVGEAVKRIQSMEELVIGEEQLATLHKFTNRLAEAKTFDDAAAVAADSIKTLLNTSTGSLSFVEDGALHHKYVYGTQVVEDFVQPLDGPGITVRAVVSGEPQLIPDVRKDAAFQTPEGVTATTLSELAVPVKVEGQVVAVINAENPELDAYTMRDQRILQILAMHLSSAFARINENESKARYRSRLEALHKLVTQLDTAQTTTDVAALTYDIIQSLTTTTYARLGLIEGDELNFLDIPNVNRHMKRLPLNGRGLTVKAARERRTIIVQDVKNDPDYVKGTLNALSELVIPIYIANRVIGVLNINSTLRNAFSPEDVKLDETIAMHISSTLERIQIDAERLESKLKIQKKEYEAEQAKELERMKTRFISTATHEIRTPLTSIKGYTELIQSELKQGNLDTTKKYFDVVERNVGRLVNLTDDLLDTQRIDEKRMVLNPRLYSVGTLMKDLKAEMTPLLQRKSQTLTITNKHQGNIYVDPNRLMQVLVNLVTNASKFSPQKSTIHVTVEKDGREALFSVQDHGIGLAAEDLPKLFKPFPEIRTESNPEGTGLGLSICRGIVEMHKGRIWAESEGHGKGTKFSFTIPEVGENEE